MGKTIRCTECHSSEVQVKAWIRPNHNDRVVSDFIDELLDEVNDCWCEECQENHKLDSYDDEVLLKEANIWWNAAPFVTLEQISALKERDYSPKDGSLEFVSACESWWDRQSDNEKITLHKQHKTE